MTLTALPSTAGQEVTICQQGSGSDRFYYFITPFGTTRTFVTKAAARTFARRHKWSVKP